MSKREMDYHKDLIKFLKNPEAAKAYLNAALMDEDYHAFLLALKNVIEAQGQEKASIARKASINRENFHRMLSSKGNPKMSTLRSALHAIGYTLAVQELEN